MRVTGICYVCQHPAVRTCRNCGQAVCSDHYRESQAVCTDCAEIRRGVGQGQRWY